MPENEPSSISEPIDQALLKILRPDLLQTYQEEKERHRHEKVEIERLRTVARKNLKRWFSQALRGQKEAELEAEYAERLQQEDDRHGAFMHELRKTFWDYR